MKMSTAQLYMEFGTDENPATTWRLFNGKEFIASFKSERAAREWAREYGWQIGKAEVGK